MEKMGEEGKLKATILNADWTVDIVGQMHKYRITNAQLAQECDNSRGESYGKTGYTPAYLSAVLNGRKQFKSEAAEENTIRVIKEALDRLITKAENDEAQI